MKVLIKVIIINNTVNFFKTFILKVFSVECAPLETGVIGSEIDPRTVSKLGSKVYNSDGNVRCWKDTPL
jgi:hypothetical protein